MKLYLIRHPQPAVAMGICYGQTDLALLPGACELTLSALLPSLPTGLKIYSSPLQRCTLLAEPLAKALGCPPLVLDADLKELDFGGWEMHTWEQIARTEIDAWVADLAFYPPGKGESLYAMAIRVIRFLDRMQAEDMSAHKELLVVCHSGTIRLMLEYRPGISALELAQKAATAVHKIGFGSCVVFTLPITP